MGRGWVKEGRGDGKGGLMRDEEMGRRLVEEEQGDGTRAGEEGRGDGTRVGGGYDWRKRNPESSRGLGLGWGGELGRKRQSFRNFPLK